MHPSLSDHAFPFDARCEMECCAVIPHTTTFCRGFFSGGSSSSFGVAKHPPEIATYPATPHPWIISAHLFVCLDPKSKFPKLSLRKPQDNHTFPCLPAPRRHIASSIQSPTRVQPVKHTVLRPQHSNPSSYMTSLHRTINLHSDTRAAEVSPSSATSYQGTRLPSHRFSSRTCDLPKSPRGPLSTMR